MTALVNGNTLHIPLADKSVHMIATSPPFFNLRDYANPDQLGQETLHDCLAWARNERPCTQCYVCNIRSVVAEAWRVLRDDGTLWLNLGDSFASGGRGGGRSHKQKMGKKTSAAQKGDSKKAPKGLKDKDLVMIPARVALALQKDGWILRSDIIWGKVNPMPESVNGWRWEQHRIKTSPSGKWRNDSNQDNPQSADDGSNFIDQSDKYKDCPGCDKCNDNNGYVLRQGAWRPTKSHEYIFMFAKTDKYYCDKYAVTVPVSESSVQRLGNGDVQYEGNKADGYGRSTYSGNEWNPSVQNGRNLWDVWKIDADEYQLFLQWQSMVRWSKETEDDTVWELPTSGYPGSHFAVWPPDLARLMILAGTSQKGVCAQCKAPYARVIHKAQPKPRHDNPNPVRPYEAASPTQGSKDSGTTLHMTRTIETKDWMPTCDCDCTEVIPATVLDIFCGSGTTLQVARSLGRFSIGIDINFDYLLNEAKSRLELNVLEAWKNGTSVITKNNSSKKTIPKNQLELF